MIVNSTQYRFGASTPPGWSPVAAVGPDPSPELGNLAVLVIEDEAMIAWMLESLLEDMGFKEITLASNAIEAAAAAVRHLPELVISDVNLGPGADGIEAVSAICHKCRPAVVFVSAYIDDRARRRISEQVEGARILSKPVSSDGLAAVIHDTLRRNRLN